MNQIMRTYSKWKSETKSPTPSSAREAHISVSNWKRLEAVKNIMLRTITGSPWFV